MSRRVAATLYGYAPIRPGALAVDLAAAVADYRAKHDGRDPLSVAVGADLGDLDAVGDVPVLVDPILAKPAGYAYLEVGP